jgi:septum site-determining protein MinC
MTRNTPSKAVEMKIATVLAGVALLHTTALDQIDAALHDITGGATDFFDGEPTIADVVHLALQKDAFDWSGLRRVLQARGLNLVAIRNAPKTLFAEIRAAGLSIDEAHAPRHESLASPASAAEAEDQPVVELSAMVVDTPVRAGQTIYAKGRDLIVTAVVNNGAEIIADGNIHVYAALKGRALAGASGNTKVRIFALSMEAELVSIAGVYRTFDEGFPAEHTKHPAQVVLEGSRIDVIDLNPSSAKRF